ncbi:MAG: helix-turn-helix domain-containing protein [Deltaproteobacteria bacterium]|nr:helix-turn-helix domain-containing protein [Deltaproteobacteria bacterium]
MNNNSLKLVDAGLVRIDECCRFLGISRAKLYEVMDQGELPYVKIGRSRRIPQQAMKEFAASRIVGLGDSHTG